ncbi:hypothetical protein [Myceligenerans halotolerans]
MRWTQRSLLVVAFGAAANLALSFVPNVVPPAVSIAIVWCTTVALAVIAVAYVYDQTVAARERADRERGRLAAELRKLRGIAWVSADREHQSASLEIWKSATERVVVFGFGMTALAHDEDLIAKTVARDIDIDVIKVDPVWLVERPAIAANIERYYDRDAGFIDRVVTAHRRLEQIAAKVNEGEGGRMRIHVFGSTVQYSGAVRDPGTPEAQGYVEFHLFRRSVERIGIGVRQYESDDEWNPPLLQHVLGSLSLAVGYDVVATRRPPALSRGDEGDIVN